MKQTYASEFPKINNGKNLSNSIYVNNNENFSKNTLTNRG